MITFWQVVCAIVALYAAREAYRIVRVVVHHRKKQKQLKALDHLANKMLWERRHGNYDEVLRLEQEFWQRMNRYREEHKR